MKNLDARCFFHLNFLNKRGFLTQKIYNVHTIFVTFLTLKMGRSQQPNVLGELFTSVPELALPRKANLIFQLISLSNATLFSIVFFTLRMILFHQ